MTIAGLLIAVAAVFPLRAIRDMAPTPELKRLWTLLTWTIVLCLNLRAAAALVRLPAEVGAGDLLDACVHLIGPSFVLGIALLSRRTARESLRLAGIERLALVDPVTGLWNRRKFDERLPDAIGGASQAQTPLHLVLLDIDHFKQVNDRFGHLAGDQMLKMVAAMIFEFFPTGAEVYRTGGDEFAVIVPDLGAGPLAMRLDHLVLTVEEARLSFAGRPSAGVTLSVGSVGRGPGDTAAALYERADAALYAAKQSGRNRVMLAA